jgi:hypothetical protein
VFNVFVCDVIQNVVCSVNTKTPHVNHQVWNIRCSVNNGKKLSIEVFTPKFSQLRHSFHELRIMPNIQSRSLETTVLVLFNLTVSPPSGNTVHRQFSTIPPSKDTLTTISRDPPVVGDHRGRLEASAIEQNTPLHTFWSFAWASTWFDGYSVPGGTGNPWPMQSGQSWPRCFTGVRSNRLNLHPVGLTKSETGNDNAKPVITLNQDVGHVLD